MHCSQHGCFLLREHDSSNQAPTDRRRVIRSRKRLCQNGRQSVWQWPWHLNSFPGPPILPPHSGHTQFKILDTMSDADLKLLNLIISASVLRATHGDLVATYACISNSKTNERLGGGENNFIFKNDTGSICTASQSAIAIRGSYSRLRSPAFSGTRHPTAKAPTLVSG